MPGVYVLLHGAHRGPRVGQQQSNQLASRALEVNEVGLQIVQTFFFSSQIIEWNLIFPLKNFKDPKCDAHTKNYKSELFGKVIKSNLETLKKLSTFTAAQRSSVTITLESTSFQMDVIHSL